ncbi:MAG TPA: tetratricopeptide repeat protein, partial [Planctomycetota bacterium]|nr:tetratricopeptide repeat protein [Planctomycetota bacterium]
MHRPTVLALPLMLALAACTATAKPESPEQKADRAAQVEASAPLKAKSFRISPPGADIEPVSSEHAAVLEMMRDPAFAQRFAESWLSETDIEPRVGMLEREVYQAVLLAVSEDDLPRAFELLGAQTGPEGNALFDYTEGNLRFTAEDFEVAAEAYERAVAKHPKYRRAWLNLGQVKARLGDFEGAVDALGHVVSLGGADSTIYALMGIALSSRQDYLAAESAFRMAMLLDPASKDWRMGLTECLFKQERFADAVAMCESLLRAEPERSEVWMLQANAYARMGQTRKAAENLEVLHGLGKGTVDTFNLLGDIYTNEQLFELARENYISALRAAPDTDGPRAVRAARDLAARGALDDSRLLIESVESIATAGIDE